MHKVERNKSTLFSKLGASYRSAWSVELELPFRQVIQAAPEDAIDDNDEERHDHDTEIDRRLVALLGHLCNVRTQAVGNELVVTPGCNLGDDAGVPRSTRRGQRTGQ